jgi:hypothetical protein
MDPRRLVKPDQGFCHGYGRLNRFRRWTGGSLCIFRATTTPRTVEFAQLRRHRVREALAVVQLDIRLATGPLCRAGYDLGTSRF